MRTQNISSSSLSEHNSEYNLSMEKTMDKRLWKRSLGISLKIELFVETMNCCGEHKQLHISDFALLNYQHILEMRTSFSYHSNICEGGSCHDTRQFTKLRHTKFGYGLCPEICPNSCLLHHNFFSFFFLILFVTFGYSNAFWLQTL